MTLILWVAAGSFIAGLLSGVVASDALDLYRASRKERPMTSRNTNRVLTGALYVALVLNFGLGIMLIQQRATVGNTARDLATYTACTNDWQQDFATAYRARYEAAVLVSEAMDGVVLAVAQQKPDAFHAAIKQYLQVREDQNTNRKAAPLPPLPDPALRLRAQGRPLMIDWDLVRWANVFLAALVVVLLIAGSMRRWHLMPLRMRRIVPWVIATYVVIAYGSGEVASSPDPVDPGLRVTMLVLVLVGLVIALLYRIDDDSY